MRRIPPLLLAASLIASPFVVSAQSTSSMIAQIQALLTQIATLQAQVQALHGQGSSAPTSQPTPAAQTPAAQNACPRLSRSLSLGSSGEDVSELQQFLIVQSVMPSSSFHGGYFDSYTEQAVQTWQRSHGIVMSGDAATTGFGVVGPRTRALISMNCALPQPSTLPTCPIARQPTDICPTKWQANVDENGCTRSYTCAVPLMSATSTATSTACTAVSLNCPVGEHEVVTNACAHLCAAN